jgi:malonate transporter
MILNSLFPVFAIIVLGHILKRFGWTNDLFLSNSDRLIYFIFFPILLFWKIGTAPPAASMNLDYCLAGLSAVTVVFVLSIFYIKIFRVGEFQAGTFSQSCYRFNTYVGMALVLNAFGEAGGRYFGILIGIIIPWVNVMAVTVLIWFSGRRLTLWKQVQVTFKAVFSNPLFIACIAGLIFSNTLKVFPKSIDNTFTLFSMVTLPLALLSIGGTLTLKNLKKYFSLSIVASGFKLIVLPLTGYFMLSAFNVTGLPFKVSMILFTLPTSTAMYVLSSQLNSDTDLASANIFLSTILSFFSLSLVLMLD